MCTFSVAQLLTYFTYVYVCTYVLDVAVPVKDIQSESVQCYTPSKASVEFGVLLDDIVQELEKDKTKNLRVLKTVSSTLTIHEKSNTLVFTDDKLEEIQACNSIETLLINKLRHCYRWYDFSLLTEFMKFMKSETCLSWLKNFEVKVKSELKLQQIYEHFRQNRIKLSEECHKVVTIVDNKSYSDITQEEHDTLKRFVSEQCGVEAYVILLSNGRTSSLILEWHIPVTAVTHMITVASSNIENFTKECFVYLKISSTVILDYRDMVSDSLRIYIIYIAEVTYLTM